MAHMGRLSRGAVLAALCLWPALASAATPSECELRLLPPSAIARGAANFLARTAGVLGEALDLADAARLTRELIERASKGDLEVTLIERAHGPDFELTAGYPASTDAIKPTVRTLELTSRAANVLFRDARAPRPVELE